MGSIPHVVIIGAGPAGLSAAYTLLKEGKAQVTVLEADPHYVGGLSRTVTYKGYHFDIGGHRFFSRSQEIRDLWRDILGQDLLTRVRSSKIFYNKKTYTYPLHAREALCNLGLMESLHAVFSYLFAQVHPVRNPKSFEDWVSNKFGRRLFTLFFKTYTEKVWGMSCREISADWAAQRIQNFSLGKIILDFLLAPFQSMRAKRSDDVKTTITEFLYPRLGPGMMWERCAQKIHMRGGTIRNGTKVLDAHFEAQKKHFPWTLSFECLDGVKNEISADFVISSAPLREFIPRLLPLPHPEVIAAAESLRYRDFITVALIVKERGRVQQNWLYIHEPRVKVGRIQNYKIWSSEMIPNTDTTCLGMEYFCNEGDPLWQLSDEQMIAFSMDELITLGLSEVGDLIDAKVIHQRKAYPVYDEGYADSVHILRAALETHYPGLQCIGRNGMHRYNNQDHAMMTGILAARNILVGDNRYDLWEVNQDAEYHEGTSNNGASGERFVPQKCTLSDKIE